MRFILGVIVGGLLTLGGAYLHDDTGVVRAGPPQPFVNWNTVMMLWPR